MKVLVTGANGQLGRCLTDRLIDQGVKFVACDSSKLDITDTDNVDTLFGQYMPDVVINAAAYTAVDQAESEPEKAYAINSAGAKILAKACGSIGAILIHVSTDYVFDGDAGDAYSETCDTNPLGVYGASKLSGEELIAQALRQHLIVRTAWVFSEYGKNFFRTMLKLGEERSQLSVVSDQFGCPTYAGDLAEALIEMARQATTKSFSNWGVYHYCGNSAVSWYDFARFIFSAVADKCVLGGKVDVSPVPSSAYPVAAPRPSFSVMNCVKIGRLGIAASDWKAAVKRLVIQSGS